MNEDQTFNDQLRRDVETVNQEWQQLQPHLKNLLTPRGTSEQSEIEEISKIAREIRERMGKIAVAVEVYKQMEEALGWLRLRAAALGTVHGISIAHEDFAPAIRPVVKPMYKQHPVKKDEPLVPKRKQRAAKK